MIDDLDLAYETPEGDSMLEGFDEDDGFEMMDDGFDLADDFDEDDDFDEGDDDFDEDAFDDEDGFDDEDDAFMDEDDFEDFEADDDFEEGDDEDDDDFDSAVGYALASESSDEFFKKLFRGIKRVGRKVGRVVKKAAPFVSRIASFIPHPAAQAVATGARLISRLRAEADGETEALEMAAEAAKRAPLAATPVVVGMIGKKFTGRKGKMMSAAARKKVAKNVRQGVKALNRRCGPTGAQAAAQIAKRVNAQVRRRSPVKKAAVFKAVAKKAAKRPAVAKKIAKKASPVAKMKGKAVAKSAATGKMRRSLMPLRGGRAMTVGGVRIVARPA